MIPKAFIDQWRGTALWASDHQVELDDGAVVTADAATEIADNHAETYGGGVGLDTGASWTGGVVRDNVANSGGGGLSLSCSSSADSVTLVQVEIRDNQADQGGGLDVGCSLHGVDLVITGNEADILGGGAWIERSSTLSGGEIRDNVSKNYEGGGIRLADSRVEVVEVDMGTGSKDNDPDDVATGDGWSAAGSWDYGDAASFTCTVSGGCSGR